MPLPRFRLRTLLIAVAAIALLLGWLTRPHPFSVSVGGGPSRIAWSDGTATEVRPSGPLPRRWRHYGPLVAVDWTDGTATWHLQRPFRGRWVRWGSVETGL